MRRAFKIFAIKRITLARFNVRPDGASLFGHVHYIGLIAEGPDMKSTVCTSTTSPAFFIVREASVPSDLIYPIRVDDGQSDAGIQSYTSTEYRSAHDVVLRRGPEIFYTLDRGGFSEAKSEIRRRGLDQPGPGRSFSEINGAGRIVSWIELIIWIHQRGSVRESPLY